MEEHENMRQRKIGIKTRSISGIIPSKKNDENVWFESALERDFALLMESDPDLVTLPTSSLGGR